MSVKDGPDDPIGCDPCVAADQTLFDRLAVGRWQISMVISGGGTGGIATCLARPGASRSFVDVCVPYSRKSMTAYLGQPPVGPNVSAQTARQLADRAHHRAQSLTDHFDGTAVGLSLTCALPTTPPRDQIHQIHVALCTDEVSRQWVRTLPAGVTSRAVAESIAQSMLLRSLWSLVSGQCETDQ